MAMVVGPVLSNHLDSYTGQFPDPMKELKSSLTEVGQSIQFTTLTRAQTKVLVRSWLMMKGREVLTDTTHPYMEAPGHIGPCQPVKRPKQRKSQQLLFE
jgi:hypothetical protein